MDTVADSTGAVIVGVQVTIENTPNGFIRDLVEQTTVRDFMEVADALLEMAAGRRTKRDSEPTKSLKTGEAISESRQ